MRIPGCIRAAVLILWVVPAAACEIETTTTPSANNPQVTNISFVGAIDPGGSSFYSFSLPRQGRVAVTLLSVRVGMAETDEPLILSLGVPSGTGCGLSTSVTVPAGATPQLVGTYQKAVYCVQVSDAGTLTERVTFAVNIARPL